MITELKISNFKSIVDETIDLSNVNVFIGENGCGKSNILEAIAMLSAAEELEINTNSLSSKGVRVTKPTLTISSFTGIKKNNHITFSYKYDSSPKSFETTILPKDINDIYSEWVVKNTPLHFNDATDEFENLVKKYINAQISKANEKVANLHLNKDELVLKALSDIRLITEYKLYQSEQKNKFLKEYLIYNINTQSLRGIINNSKETPLGINGEGLDVLLNNFSKEEWNELKKYSYLISWLDDFIIDESDTLKYQGHKSGRSSSFLYFKDKFMKRNNNVFAAENSNEGVLHVLFYLTLLISKKTPKFFAIDNIEASLNPKLCRTLMKIVASLAIEQNKQILVTTHNPAIIDGINLFDEKQRLFVVKRDDSGITRVERIITKKQIDGKDIKLSEMWMRGYLGGVPNNF